MIHHTALIIPAGYLEFLGSPNNTQLLPWKSCKLPEHTEFLIWASLKPGFSFRTLASAPVDEKNAGLAILV